MAAELGQDQIHNKLFKKLDRYLLTFFFIDDIVFHAENNNANIPCSLADKICAQPRFYPWHCVAKILKIVIARHEKQKELENVQCLVYTEIPQPYHISLSL